MDLPNFQPDPVTTRPQPFASLIYSLYQIIELLKTTRLKSSKSFQPQIDGRFGTIKFLDMLLQIWSAEKL